MKCLNSAGKQHFLICHFGFMDVQCGNAYAIRTQFEIKIWWDLLFSTAIDLTKIYIFPQLVRFSVFNGLTIRKLNRPIQLDPSTAMCTLCNEYEIQLSIAIQW